MTKPHLNREHALHLLKEMLRIRRFEEKCAEVYTQEKIRGFLHLYIGEEANAVGVMQALGPDDAVVATYREHGHALARGEHTQGGPQAGQEPQPRRLVRTRPGGRLPLELVESFLEPSHPRLRAPAAQSYSSWRGTGGPGQSAGAIGSVG